MLRPSISVGRWATLAAATLFAQPIWGTEAVTATPERLIADEIDAAIERKLQERGVVPAPQATDATLVRRLTLDLVGRIPTMREARAYVDSTHPAKREELIARLMKTPEYIRHNAREFDRLISGENESAPSLETYLTQAMEQRKSWDRIFTELVGVGPEPNDDASRFVIGRFGDRDALTRDVSSVFFGVNVSCCQCHDHPSVDYLTQDFYFGLKAFFHRSYDFNGRLMDRIHSEFLTFKSKDGDDRTARLLLVSGTSVEIPPVDEEGLPERIAAEDKQIAETREQFEKQKQYPESPAVSPRKLLVDTALKAEERLWLAKSIVNRLWYRFFGHGLVMRVDQMHPENPPSHPELLEWLAMDFVEHGYDLHRMMNGLVLSRTFSRSSQWLSEGSPTADLFAVAQVRPLTPMQYGLSLRIASRPDLVASFQTDEQWNQQLLQLEAEAKASFAPLLPAPTDGLQIGAQEALRLSNDPESLKLLGEGLVGSLSPAMSAGERMDRLYWTVLSRPAEPEETQAVVTYLQDALAAIPADLVQTRTSPSKADDQAISLEGSVDRPSSDQGALDRYRSRVQQVAWALLTGSEFRFNH